MAVGEDGFKSVRRVRVDVGRHNRFPQKRVARQAGAQDLRDRYAAMETVGFYRAVNRGAGHIIARPGLGAAHQFAGKIDLARLKPPQQIAPLIVYRPELYPKHFGKPAAEHNGIAVYPAVFPGVRLGCGVDPVHKIAVLFPEGLNGAYLALGYAGYIAERKLIYCHIRLFFRFF